MSRRGNMEARALALVAILGLLVACDGNINLFGSPTQVQSGADPTPSASPSASPTPSPSPSATPSPCKALAIVAAFSGGSQPNEITVTEVPKRLDATAFNDQGEIQTGCNLTRFPVWEVSKATQANCSVLGSGWNPNLDGIRVGSCELRACLRQTGDGACFADPLPGESAPVTSPVFQVSVK